MIDHIKHVKPEVNLHLKDVDIAVAGKPAERMVNFVLGWVCSETKQKTLIFIGDPLLGHDGP